MLDLTPAKKPRKAKPKPYVPALRSGAYALIKALSTLSPRECWTKAQLIAAAQEYCESSFTVARESGGFYTAWNSMKTLIDKDLVDERGRPSRTYALTDEGWEVARKMQAAAEDSEVGLEQSNIDPTAGRGGFNDIVDLEDDVDDQEHRATQICNSRPLEKATKPIPKGQDYPGQRLGGAVTDKFGTIGSPHKPSESSRHDFRELLSSPAPQQVLDSDPELAQAIRASLRDNIPQIPRPRSQHSERPSKSPDKDPRPPDKAFVPATFEPIRLQPGTFTVHLIVDTREVYSKEHRDYMENELIKKGIRPLLRSLDLGDFFWVAKCHDPHLLARYGEEPGSDEIVLDWIVERKTLEDLIGSVKDGRFHEQKFRLRKSGVKNVIYLIKDKTLSQEHAQKYHEMMESAVASTQVVDGYFVKRTQKIDDTIRYLARMTTMLKGLYETKPLHLIPTKHLTPRTYLPLLTHLRATHPNKFHNITYASFSSLASKSDGLVLRDIFLKMLMCTRLVTGDKALEIQKHWNTPKALFDAMEKCGDRKEREALLAKKLGAGVGRKAMGKKVFENLVEVWGSGG